MYAAVENACGGDMRENAEAETKLKRDALNTMN
jgi:hypothetical protein